jgi:hypothetical protein
MQATALKAEDTKALKPPERTACRWHPPFISKRLFASIAFSPESRRGKRI